MESERVQARGVIMREGKNGEDAATAEGGWLDWLRDRGIAAIGGIDTRALVRHIRDRGAMRGGIFPAELAEAEARERRRGRALDGGRGLRPRGDAARAGRVRRRRPPRGRDRHRDQALDHPAAARAGLPGHAAPVRQLRRGGPRARSRPGLPRQRPRRPRRPRLRGRERPRAWSARSPSSASASATSCSAARWASRPSSSPSATAAPTTRSRTSRPAGSTSPPRTTASRSSGPGGDRTIEGDEPVRWQTDFGEAELSHLNLYDRTVEGLVLKDVPGCTVQYHPEAGPGPHDARYLFDRFLELAE